MGVAASSVRSRIRVGEIRREVPKLLELDWNRAACPEATLRKLCLTEGLEPEALSQLDRLIAGRVRLHRGGKVFRAGERFVALYAIRSGSCKTISLTEGGEYKVAGYHMAGEIIGTDGIDDDRHVCEAEALEDIEVSVLPFTRLEAFGRQNARFQHNLHRLLSREIARQGRLTLLLGTMSAERRLAMFLLDLSERYHARGYSACEFVLRMTREEIGSYLGLKLETVSRMFSRFQHDGLVQVQGRVVKLLDRASLKRLIDS
jgi:CRP/FNR family transcriptional regulator